MSAGAVRNRKVRYGVVGGGWISQAAFMPSVAQTGNSELAAFVTGDAEKAEAVRALYGIGRICGYDGFPHLLASGDVDAIYLALPNRMHRGHRQLVELRLRWGAIGTACSWLRRSGDAGDLGPSLEGLAPGGSILGGGHLMAAKVEEVADPIVGGQEALRLAG